MAERDSVERELKFAAADLDGLRKRLEEMGAERLEASGLERNWIFDRGGELAGAGSVLRLRQDSAGARVTFKGPAAFEGGVKLRREIEIEVDDLERARELLAALGYERVREYQKRRERWRLGGVEVALDHTPIGDFAELEGEAAEAVAKRCGLDPAAAERRTYLQLYDDYLADHPGAPPDMVFESRRGGSD